MPNIENEQYALVMQCMLRINDYSSDIAKQAGVTEAIQVLKSVMKGVKPAEPSGGSYCGCSTCKGQKIHRLFNMFGIK